MSQNPSNFFSAATLQCSEDAEIKHVTDWLHRWFSDKITYWAVLDRYLRAKKQKLAKEIQELYPLLISNNGGQVLVPNGSERRGKIVDFFRSKTFLLTLRWGQHLFRSSMSLWAFGLAKLNRWPATIVQRTLITGIPNTWNRKLTVVVGWAGGRENWKKNRLHSEVDSIVETKIVDQIFDLMVGVSQRSYLSR